MPWRSQDWSSKNPSLLWAVVPTPCPLSTMSDLAPVPAIAFVFFLIPSTPSQHLIIWDPDGSGHVFISSLTWFKI